MFRSLNVSKVQKSSLTSSTDFDFLMKSMHREREKEREKENVGAFNWVEQNKKKKVAQSLVEKAGNGDWESVMGKITTFIEITLRLLSQEHHSQTLVKQARSLGQYLQSKILTLTLNTPDTQRLLELQKQNQQLQQLIHSHQLTNIRMHIRINDEESSDIETYKQKLENSYISYKKLEEKVAGYKSKINQLHTKVGVLSLQNSTNVKTIHYLQSLLKKKSQQLSLCTQNDSVSVQQLQSVIDDQNNQLEKMCDSLREIVGKHQQKQGLWSDEVIQYKNKIRQLERKLGERETKSKQVINWKEGEDELWRCVFLQAGVIQKLI